MPLPAIGRVLAGEDVAGTLAAVRDRLEVDLARRRHTLAALDRVLAEGLPKVEVTVTREPARKVLVVRDTATPTTIGETTSSCVARLFQQVTPAGALIGLFPVDLAEEFVVGVAAEAEDGATEVLPGGSFALATHLGPYEQINLTAHGLPAWLGERGRVAHGPIREVYLTNPNEVSPDRLVTQVMIKLEDET